MPVGRISGLFGVRGWVKIFSYTDPRPNILNYNPWWLSERPGEWRPVQVIEGRAQGKGVVVQLAECGDTDVARGLIGVEIGVPREVFPAAAPGQYYWADLLGLRVETETGLVLGTVTDLLATGANDVLVIGGEREHLVPFVPGVIRQVDIAAGRVCVAWDPDF